MGSSQKNTIHPIRLVALSFIVVLIFGMSLWVVWRLMKQSQTSELLAVQSHEIETPSQLPKQEEITEEVELVLPKMKVVFLSKLKKTLSINVRCGEKQQEGQKSVTISLTDAESCTVMAVDAQKTRHMAYLDRIESGRYRCFLNGKSDCKKEPPVKKERGSKKDRVAREKKVTPSVETKEATGPSYITISADSQAKVFINGKFVRMAPLYKYRASPGKHRAHIAHADGRIKRFSINIEAGQERIYKWSFIENRWLQKSKRKVRQ